MMNVEVMVLIGWLTLGAWTVFHFRKHLQRQAYEGSGRMVANGTPLPYKAVYIVVVLMSVVLWPAVWYGRIKK